MTDDEAAARVERNAELLGATAITCTSCGDPTLQVTPTRTQRAVCSSCQKS